MEHISGRDVTEMSFGSKIIDQHAGFLVGGNEPVSELHAFAEHEGHSIVAYVQIGASHLQWERRVILVPIPNDEIFITRDAVLIRKTVDVPQPNGLLGEYLQGRMFINRDVRL